MPTVADNDPQLASPRGIAVRFYLADHVHTDIVAHSHDGFPVRTGEEFLEFLRAAAAFGQGQPAAFGAFLASHPRARQFVEAPKPIPSSFARESFFAVTAFRFTNPDGPEPLRTVPHPAGSRERPPHGRRRRGEVGELPLRRA